MWIELFYAVCVAAVSLRLFRHFQSGTPLRGRLTKWGVYLSGVALLVATLGRPWSMLLAYGLPLLGTALHVGWCWRHGIHPLTSEPRGRYRRLRGWTVKLSKEIP